MKKLTGLYEMFLRPDNRMSDQKISCQVCLLCSSFNFSSTLDYDINTEVIQMIKHGLDTVNKTFDKQTFHLHSQPGLSFQNGASITVVSTLLEHCLFSTSTW